MSESEKPNINPVTAETYASFAGAAELGSESSKFAGGQNFPTSLQGSAKSVFLSAKPGLDAVERRVRSRLVSEAAELEHISEYLLTLGGKRIRPLLAILGARLFGMSPQAASSQLIDVAAGIELIHMATLLHDDIIDQSPLRRNKQSAFAKFGFTPSLLAGDFLWVRAFGLCAHLGEFIVRSTEDACVELTEGEILEGRLTVESPQSLEIYLDIVSKKTASLFGLATSVGAHCAGANEEAVQSMKHFGRSLGGAFQMVDDILDVTADETLLGKPSGTDLRQRTPSLVNILWLKSGEEAALEFFSAKEVTNESLRKALDHLSRSPVIDRAREIAREHAEKAREHLLSIDDNALDLAAQEDLSVLIDFTLQRCM